MLKLCFYKFWHGLCDWHQIRTCDCNAMNMCRAMLRNQPIDYRIPNVDSNYASSYFSSHINFVVVIKSTQNELRFMKNVVKPCQRFLCAFRFRNLRNTYIFFPSLNPSIKFA